MKCFAHTVQRVVTLRRAACSSSRRLDRAFPTVPREYTPCCGADACSRRPCVADVNHTGVLNVTWIAPTTNADGNPLTDLAFYRVFFGVSGSSCRNGSFTADSLGNLKPAARTDRQFPADGPHGGVALCRCGHGRGRARQPERMLDDRQSIAQMNFDVLPTATIKSGRVNVGSNDDANNSLVCEADNHPQTFAFTCPESVSSGRFASAS